MSFKLTGPSSKEGYLLYYKYEKGEKVWARKYFWLYDQDNYMLYADVPELSKAQRRINLDGALADEVAAKAKKFQFKVTNSKNITHHFRAKSENDMLDWLDAICPPIWSDEEQQEAAAMKVIELQRETEAAAAEMKKKQLRKVEADQHRAKLVGSRRQPRTVVNGSDRTIKSEKGYQSYMGALAYDNEGKLTIDADANKTREELLATKPLPVPAQSTPSRDQSMHSMNSGRASTSSSSGGSSSETGSSTDSSTSESSDEDTSDDESNGGGNRNSIVLGSAAWKSYKPPHESDSD